MTEDGAFNIVRAWLVRLAADAIVLDPLRAPLGEIIRDHQDGPRPEGAYATINLLGSDDLEEVRCEEFRAVEVEIEGEPLPVERFALKSTRAVEFRFRIDVFASRPMEWIRLFRTAAMAGDMQVDLLPLVVRDVGEAQRAPDLTQAHWEGRARFDVAFGALVADEMIVDGVESGAVNFEGEGGATVQETLNYVRA